MMASKAEKTAFMQVTISMGAMESWLAMMSSEKSIVVCSND
jgi:hypothetical protein